MGTKREEEEEDDDVEKKLDETRGVIDSAKKNDDKHCLLYTSPSPRDPL